MTTVSYSNLCRTMACDSLWTENELCAVSRTKIRLTKNGCLLGFAGANDSRALIDILERVKGAVDLPTLPLLQAVRIDASALLVLPTGRIFSVATVGEHNEDDDPGVTEVSWPFWAIGTGGHIAIGHMGAHKTARQATAFACKLDPNSRLPVHTLSLPERPHRRGKK